MFLEVACPNEECEQYGCTGQGNIVGNALMKPNPVESESTSAEHAARSFVIEATQCSMI